jgi:hypothetical protein
MLAIVLLQRELRAIGRAGLGESVERLHPASTQQVGAEGNEKDLPRCARGRVLVSWSQ